MNIVILQSNYIPWKGYFDLIHDADIFVFYDCVQYTKNTWRNRNQVYGKDGLAWLSIPIDKKAVKLCIDEVKLPEAWQKHHAHYLRDVYRKAPYLNDLNEFIETIYEQQTWTHLYKLNQHIIRSLCDKMNFKTQFINARELDCTGNRVEKLINLVKQLDGDTYISGASANNYLEPYLSDFEESNLKLTYKEYGPYRPYSQLHSPFVDTVSIVDLIANLGFKQMSEYVISKPADSLL